ncbi:MAG TPA: flagellar M-ring protein FliF C-terminal domain-containing protein, partial [Chthonomonadaceae bacterium]|nr:flagellar M-ring protein FliF C-terminal domain-containing protein [Chthonomonadaceae bacterium]
SLEMQHARQWWEGLGSRRRFVMIVSSLGFVVALIGLLYGMGAMTASYVPLGADLPASEAGNVLTTLREAHIPFRLEAGGSRIEVPAADHDAALVLIARRSAPAPRSYAETRQDELQSLIDNTLGPHKAVVLVSAELSADKEETQTTSNGVATTLTEELNGARAAASAGSGLIPPAGGRYVHATAVKTSQPSHTVRRIVRGPGRVERLAVSALIDSTVPPGEVAAIKQALEAAISASPKDPSRTVSVAQVPFDRSAEEGAARAVSEEEALRLLQIVLPLVLMAGCLLLMARALRRQNPFAAGALGLDPVEVLPAGLPGGSGASRSGGALEAGFDADLESLKRLSRSHPQTVAMLLKNWIREEYRP